MKYLTKYYKTLAEKLQEEVNFLENMLNEGTLKKALKHGGKDPGRIARAVESQKRRLPLRQKERSDQLPLAHELGMNSERVVRQHDDSRISNEFEAAYEYADDALGKPYASGMDAEDNWATAAKITSILGDTGNPKDKTRKHPNQKVQSIIGNLAQLSISKFFGHRKPKKKTKKK